MALEVAIFETPFRRRSNKVCQAMAAGVRSAGDNPVIIDSRLYRRRQHKIALFYGLEGPLKSALKHQEEDGGIAIYIDLGYWGRIAGGKLFGYHKVVVNGRHPTKYFQKRTHDASRANDLGVKPLPWKKGGKHILLAGMSAKAAMAEGFSATAWERSAVRALKEVTDRPIVYRAKPNWKAARPIAGAFFSPLGEESLERALSDCHAVVTHHSNVSVDGLVAGVPAFVVEGVASPLARHDLTKIERPSYPDGREKWIADVAWCQFKVSEMMQGIAWRHLKDEGLIPC